MLASPDGRAEAHDRALDLRQGPRGRRVWVLGFRVQGLGFRAHDFPIFDQNLDDD